MEKDESFNEFYAKLIDIVNLAFNLGETILEPKVVRKVLRFLPKRFHAKITAIKESKHIDSIPLTELVGNLQTYELGLIRIGKRSKSKSMALNAKSNETNESSYDEDSNMKSYITRQFKKFMKNANAKGFDKDRKQSSHSYFESQDKKKDAEDGGQYTIPSKPKYFECQGFGHMKQECQTYLKSVGKSKALATTLSDAKPKIESDDSDDEGILNGFLAPINPTEGVIEIVDDEEDLVDSKFKKMNDQYDIRTAYAKLYKVSETYEKLYRLATKKLSDVKLDRKELSAKIDEANQTVGALQFENKFLTKRTKKLEAELFQVRAQLERTSRAKLDEMLSYQNAAYDKTGLGYDFSSPSIASSSKIVFASPADNVNSENNEFKTEIASENLDKGKSILGAPPKVEKKETRNHRTKKVNNKKS